MARLGHGSIGWPRREQSRAVTSCVVVLAVVLVGCAETPEPELPDPPDGSELVLEVGDLEVYKTFGGELCAGTLRRIEQHANGLAELFDMDPPRARVFLYDDVDAVMHACWTGVWGCARDWGASALPPSALHEMAHVFMRAATDNANTRPFIEEGAATRLEGAWVDYGIAGDEDLVQALASKSSLDASRGLGAHVFAWALDRNGFQSIVDAHVDTAGVEDEEELQRAFAAAFGFASLDELAAEFWATRRLQYPALPDTVGVLRSDQLMAGAHVDASCGGPYTEGPQPGAALRTTFRLEITQPGLYEVEHDPIPALTFWKPLLRPTDPAYDAMLAAYADVCVDGEHIAFPTPQQYEVGFDHALAETFDASVSATYVGGDACP
ncbi:MAG: hypothetical protein U0168_10955 [Nannocystaceae bacterium]